MNLNEQVKLEKDYTKIICKSYFFERPHLKLPICKPSVTCYLHHGLKLAILETDENARRHLTNNFLQLFSRVDQAWGGATLIDFFGYDGLYMRPPMLDWARLSAPLLKKMGGKIADQMCAALDMGHYLEVSLDEFYLSCKPAYQRFHYLHPSLIYGYSQEERYFYAIGFDHTGSFREFTISYDEFTAGMTEDAGVAFLSWLSNPVLTNSQTYSPDLVKAYLNDFLESRNSFITHRPANAHFGFATYEVAIDCVENHNASNIDLRPWCVFHDHKKKLQALSEFLARERGALFDVEFENEVKLLGQDFLALRNYMIEAKATNTPVKISSLRSNLERLAVGEKIVIQGLIDRAV